MEFTSDSRARRRSGAPLARSDKRSDSLIRERKPGAELATTRQVFWLPDRATGRAFPHRSAVARAAVVPGYSGVDHNGFAPFSLFFRRRQVAEHLLSEAECITTQCCVKQVFTSTEAKTPGLVAKHLAQICSPLQSPASLGGA